MLFPQRDETAKKMDVALNKSFGSRFNGCDILVHRSESMTDPHEITIRF